MYSLSCLARSRDLSPQLALNFLSDDNAITTMSHLFLTLADLSKLVARSRNPVSLSADSIPSTADLWHASWGEPLSSLSLGTPFLAPPGKAQRQGLESDVVALCKKLSNWNRVSSFLHALGCGSLLVGLAIVVEDLRSQTQPPFRYGWHYPGRSFSPISL